MIYYIKKNDRYVAQADVTGNGVLVYYFVKNSDHAQEFTKLEADMFLALIRRSTLLSNKEKKGYKVINAEQHLVEMFEKLKSMTTDGKWKVRYNAEPAGNTESNN